MTIEDIKRLNYDNYQKPQAIVNNPHNILLCTLSFFLRIIYQILKRRFGTVSINNLYEILVIAPSINNQKSVRSIISFLPKGKYSLWSDYTEVLPLAKIYLRSLKYLPLFFRLYLKSSVDERKLIRCSYPDFFTTCATYDILEKVLKTNAKLKLVVFANDHVLENRCLIELCEKLEIKTLYVQHASVNETFPPLRFDYSFLDGFESYEKYKRIGNMRGQTFLLGSPRFDIIHTYKNVEKKFDVGIALNILDSIPKALELCLYLKNKHSLSVIVRPHPRMINGLFDENLFQNRGISISDPRRDLSYVFISQIKVMIANESSIHLDAALMDVPSIFYNFSNNKVLDWYSYKKNGLIKEASSFEDIETMLTENHHLSEKDIRYYVASFHTPIDGRVGEIIANFIMKNIDESTESSMVYIKKILQENDSCCS